jgi:hypothetical protein
LGCSKNTRGNKADYPRKHAQPEYLEKLALDQAVPVQEAAGGSDDHAGQAGGQPHFSKARLQVCHYHRVRRKRDEDNLAPKFLLDALCQAGILADDNTEVLSLLPARFEIDRSAWRTEVYIWGDPAKKEKPARRLPGSQQRLVSPTGESGSKRLRQSQRWACIGCHNSSGHAL